MGPYCGSWTPPSFTSVDNKVRLEFRSDSLDQKSGFRAVWKSVKTRNETFGFITTPNYPDNHPDCGSWRLAVISAPKGYKIVFQVIDLDLPKFGGDVLVYEGTPFRVVDESPYCSEFYDYYDYYYYNYDYYGKPGTKHERKYRDKDETQKLAEERNKENSDVTYKLKKKKKINKKEKIEKMKEKQYYRDLIAVSMIYVCTEYILLFFSFWMASQDLVSTTLNQKQELHLFTLTLIVVMKNQEKV